MADIKRLNYFNGQFLKQEDFNDEQAYHIDLRRRLNQTLHTWGVADTGLQVSLVPGTTNQISVGAGMALDNQGREIVLLTPQTKNLSGEPANSDVYVTIQYQETKTDPPPNSTDSTLFTRWTEVPKVEIVRTLPAADGAVLTLAKIRLDGSSNVVSPIDQSVRTAASSKIAPKSDLQVGSLTCESVGIGTTNSSRPLTIRGQGVSEQLLGFEDPAGRATWHINQKLGGTNPGLNLAESGVADGRLFIKPGGNVGIGTTDPKVQLHVSDTLAVGPITSGLAKGRIEASGPIAELGFIRRNLASWPASPAAGDRFVWYNPDGSARLWTDVVGDLLIVAKDGSLAFGNETGQMLNLWNKEYGIGIQGGTQYYRTATNFAWFKGGVHHDNAFNPGTGGTVQMVINNSGNVGIGTANPGGKLDVAGDIRAGNSDIYFTKTDHNHTGIGNTPGFAAIENASNFEALMILGRQTPRAGRVVRLWDYLQVNGTLEVTGSLVAGGGKGGYVVDRFVNNLEDTLEEGDVVVIGENQTSQYYGLHDNIPIPEVDTTQRVYDTRVCGIVNEIHMNSIAAGGEANSVASENRETKAKSAKARNKTKAPASPPGELDKLERTKVGPGQMGTMVTLGAFAHCKVDADIAPIKVGDLLTTSPTKGHAQKVLDQSQAVGAIIGKALGSLKKGKGKIPVLVMLQ